MKIENIKTPIIGIIGNKNSGKTTLILNIIKEMNERKYKIFVMKKSHHNFAIDMPDTDSWKFRKAGAEGTAIISEHKIAIMIEEHTQEIQIDKIIEKLPKYDFIILESYKKLDIPKIEVRAKNNFEKKIFFENYPNIRAIVGEYRQEEAEKIKIFEHQDITKICDFIVRILKLSKSQIYKQVKNL